MKLQDERRSDYEIPARTLIRHFLSLELSDCRSRRREKKEEEKKLEKEEKEARILS